MMFKEAQEKGLIKFDPEAIRICDKCLAERKAKFFQITANGYREEVCLKCPPVNGKYKLSFEQRLYANNYSKKKRRENIQFRLLSALRSRVSATIKTKNKTIMTRELIGCSVKMFKEQLFLKMAPGMTFENYGEWQIDHVKPCSWFDLTDIEQQKQCFHFSNTKPMWKKDNTSKGNRYSESF